MNGHSDASIGECRRMKSNRALAISPVVVKNTSDLAQGVWTPVSWPGNGTYSGTMVEHYASDLISSYWDWLLHMTSWIPDPYPDAPLGRARTPLNIRLSGIMLRIAGSFKTGRGLGIQHGLSEAICDWHSMDVIELYIFWGEVIQKYVESVWCLPEVCQKTEKTWPASWTYDRRLGRQSNSIWPRSIFFRF